MINANANSYQINQGTAARSAQQTARTQQNTGTNRAAIESRVESQAKSNAKSEVKREEAGKSAAEQMRKENTAITEKPDEGIELTISKKGLEKEQQAKNQNDRLTAQTDRMKAADDKKAAEDKKAKAAPQDEKSATEQRVEEQQKVREKIREQVKKELNDEEQKTRQTERREEEREDRQKVEQKTKQEDDARQQNISNFAGYTNAQLQQMAQRGDISQNDYRTEIEKREEKVTETQQSLSNTDKEIARGIEQGNRAERQMNAVNTAFDEESNNNVNAETRAEIVQNLENPQNTQTVQQNNQREQQARAFAQWQSDFGFLIR